MGGDDDIKNLVALPPKAHYIAHFLLCKSYPDNEKLSHAFAMMAVNNPRQHRKSCGFLYEQSKIARSNALKGKPRPEWVKEKLRKPKANTENMKKPKTSEHAKNISNALAGKKKSESHIKNLVLSRKKYEEQRKCETLDRIEHYRNLFIKSGLDRKDFYVEYNLNPSTGKRYLRGL